MKNLLLLFVYMTVALTSAAQNAQSVTGKTYQIKTIAPAKVAYMGEFSNENSFLLLDHFEGYFTMYFALNKEDLVVSEDEMLDNGQQIAIVDSLWLANGSHMELVLGEANDVLAFLLTEYLSNGIGLDTADYLSLESALYDIYYSDYGSPKILDKAVITSNRELRPTEAPILYRTKAFKEHVEFATSRLPLAAGIIKSSSGRVTLPTHFDGSRRCPGRKSSLTSRCPGQLSYFGSQSNADHLARDF